MSTYTIESRANGGYRLTLNGIEGHTKFAIQFEDIAPLCRMLENLGFRAEKIEWNCCS